MEIKLVFRNIKMQCYVCKMNHGKFSLPKEEEKLQKWMKSVGIICSNLSSENQKFSVSSRPQPRNVVFDGKESLSCPEDKNCVLSCDEMDLNKK